jgi:hypothetical protein
MLCIQKRQILPVNRGQSQGGDTTPEVAVTAPDGRGNLRLGVGIPGLNLPKTGMRTPLERKAEMRPGGKRRKEAQVVSYGCYWPKISVLVFSARQAYYV